MGITNAHEVAILKDKIRSEVLDKLAKNYPSSENEDKMAILYISTANI